MTAFIAAISGVISIALAPIIFVIGMISIIGIPFALIALVLPTLCLWIVISYLVFRIKPLHTKYGIVRSFVIASLIMLAVPQIYNFQVNGAVSELQSGDMKGTLAPLRASETLAVIKGSGRSVKCFNACIDLLLSGQIAAYLTVPLPRNFTEPTGDMKAMRHRLVRSQTCDNPNLVPHNRSSNEDKPGTVANQLKLASQRGICIQSTEMQLKDLGAMRVVLEIDRKRLDYPESVFFIDTQIRPSRIAVYEKSADQKWTKIAQQTNVSYSLLGPVLAHAISGGTISSTKSSWWRKNTRAEYTNFEKFMASKMGAKLRPQ